jgi:ketosteroid isomerase-like protein
MNKMKTGAIIAVCCWLLAACGTKPGAAANAFSIEPIKAHIAEMNKNYGYRFTHNDTAFIAARYYCANAEVFPAEHPIIKGRDSIRAYYYDGGKNVEITILINAVNVYGSADLVVEEGSYDFPDGKGGSYDKGKFIALWKEEDGKWKLFREIWNTDLARAKQ